MKRSPITIILAFALASLFASVGWAQPQQPPPDVIIQWTGINIPLADVASQDIPLNLPTTNISRYSFHYVYVYMPITGSCIASGIDANTTGMLTGTYANSPNPPGVIPIGGLLTQNFAVATLGGQSTLVLVLKGNGAVSSINGNLHVVRATGGHIGSCTLNLLYKATTHEEEGISTTGIYAPTEAVLSNFGIVPTVGTISGTVSSYQFNIPSVGEAGYKSTMVIDKIHFCVNPVNGTQIYRGTSPVSVIMNAGGAYYLGKFSVTNSCFTVDAGQYGTVLVTPTYPLQVTVEALTATGYPTADMITGDFSISAFGHVIY